MRSYAWRAPSRGKVSGPRICGASASWKLTARPATWGRSLRSTLPASRSSSRLWARSRWSTKVTMTSTASGGDAYTPVAGPGGRQVPHLAQVERAQDAAAPRVVGQEERPGLRRRVGDQGAQRRRHVHQRRGEDPAARDVDDLVVAAAVVEPDRPRRRDHELRPRAVADDGLGRGDRPGVEQLERGVVRDRRDDPGPLGAELLGIVEVDQRTAAAPDGVNALDE